MKRTRRQFLYDVAAVAAASASARAAAAAPPPDAAVAAPTVLATWDYGLPLVKRAQQLLLDGRDLLDALEAGVNVVEDDPQVMTVGFGSLPNEDGVVQLDAAIMDGRTHRAGAVAALEKFRHPISVARKVMERTRHVMLAGPGAAQFARKLGFAEEELLTPEAKAAWLKRRENFWHEGHDTVCCIGRDVKGNLATAVSTSGLPWKIAGRVGDSPIIGAGSYVDNDVGAACATGVGELAMRTCASFAIVERMRAGASPTAACTAVLEQILKIAPEVKRDARLQLAFIALNKEGHVGAAVYRAQKKLFRYALAQGHEDPRLHDVTPMLDSPH
jgi:isoaspartyl peptidase/L-asparaginase-like protein (Ntn-hydrolase superfamily)